MVNGTIPSTLDRMRCWPLLSLRPSLLGSHVHVVRCSVGEPGGEALVTELSGSELHVDEPRFSVVILAYIIRPIRRRLAERMGRS